ncbi:MAG: adenosylhomocysteinase [Candidatus Woesearchaeota archaeon]|jgi:adenosylhomocysteinase|nr:adenosylhomocysteinase [Candidatus Woesearchaeota archaeon]MDP7324220.1 adenosylhomocysteinase [Candidatus Woesearchaeota archaeon]MDP7457626.1 adenosylhomocysteinase [Candidatus Woesearchaeota archaeon]
MDKGDNYEVKDISLAEQGMKNLEWAEMQMGALLNVKERFVKEKPLQDVKVGLALHVTKETGILIRTLIAGGAKVAITGCNPLSTQDDVAAALAKEGVHIWAYKGETNEDYYRYLTNVINFKPDITIDDGCDLVSEIHNKHTELIPNIIGGAEETTTGIIRLNAMEKDKALKYPIVAVNDANTKHLMDNIKGTGQSVFDGILRATNVIVAGKTVVVIGYGNCGKGVAKRAQGLDAQVIVTEVDAFCALQAAMDGHRVMPMVKAAEEGDIFITVTGNKHVISYDHIKTMKEGALLCNAGHFDAEIEISTLEENKKEKRRIRPFMDQYKLENGRSIFILGEGRLINLAAAEGHPSTIMAMSFCNQAFACEFLVQNKGKLEPKIYQLPPEKDDEIATLQLESMGIEIDKLTEEQEKYLNSWQEGT